MAQAKRAKAKPKQRPKFTDKAQSERFIEAARNNEALETGERFDESFKRIVKPIVPR
jgi:hypothetical protein